MKLITRLLNTASKKHPGIQVDSRPWIARPTTVSCLLPVRLNVLTFTDPSSANEWL